MSVTQEGSLHRLAAFTDHPEGGNPAGVWVGDELPAQEAMQQIAADVGYSETAFVAPATGARRVIRYYSPLAEVSFCGHATIATGVVLGRANGAGDYFLQSAVGEILVRVSNEGERWAATLTSVDTHHKPVDAVLLRDALSALRWKADELDPDIPPAVAYAGASHLVLAVANAGRLEHLDYDFEALKSTMLAKGLTTLQLVWRAGTALFHSRNPFPVGGVVEDAATGASAAALGGYLRDSGRMETPFDFEIRQGEAMGRPSELRVHVPIAGGIEVTGTATDIPDSMH
jgi:PhzF family phenazine biosynthesis protein